MTPVDVALMIGSHLPEPEAGLLSGMVLGTKQALPDDLITDLTTTGTLHIVALSGTNITIIVTLVAGTLRSLFSKQIASLLTILALIWFVFFVGASPSVVRAAVMGILSLLAVIAGRQAAALWLLFLAAAGMIAVNREIVTDLSFQLSVAATSGLILFAPGGKPMGKTVSTARVTSDNQVLTARTFIRNIWAGVFQYFLTAMHTTLAAQVFTLPLILFHFRRISLISPLPNAVIAPLLTPVTAGGIVMILIGLVNFPIARAVAWFVFLGLRLIVLTVGFFARFPLASIGF